MYIIRSARVMNRTFHVDSPLYQLTSFPDGGQAVGGLYFEHLDGAWLGERLTQSQ